MVRSIVTLLLVCALHSGVWATPQDQTTAVDEKPQVITEVRYETVVLPDDVHTAVVGGSAASDGLIGCFKDTGDRDLPQYAHGTATNSIESCRGACQGLGFRFAGVQYSSHCFCGNSFGKFGKATNCDMKCSGNNGQICGGTWANSVYTVPGYVEPQPEGPFQYYGCYKDTAARDLPHLAHGTATNSIQSCRGACQGLGFKFAGLQYTHYCFCGNSFGKFGKATNCDAKCPGNNEQTCGGTWANSIYGVDGYVEPKPEGELEHFGCFRDTAVRDLVHYAYGSESISIENCKSECKKLGFRFAGVQYRSHCFCGNSFGRYGRAGNCDMKCAGNNDQICGGTWANSVYSAAYVTPKPSKYPLIGCFRDTGVRDLPRYSHGGITSIDKCVTACQQLGMKFAGLQYAAHCFCGDSYGKFGPANNCNMRCSGNHAQICGGTWANSVYDAAVLN